MLNIRLRELRKSKGLTQVEMANHIGVARTTYAMYEQGKREPDYETLQKIANFHKTTVDYLLGRTDKSAPSNSFKLTNKDEQDIAKRMQKIREDLIKGNADGTGLIFMGEPMSEEAIESLLAALEHAERIATLANKKYIPKKYRKE